MCLRTDGRDRALDSSSFLLDGDTGVQGLGPKLEALNCGSYLGSNGSSLIVFLYSHAHSFPSLLRSVCAKRRHEARGTCIQVLAVDTAYSPMSFFESFLGGWEA